MPVAKKREESEYRFPAGEYFPAVLKAVSEKEIKYTVKKGPKAGQDASFIKWEWVFDITDGEYQGLSAYGETGSDITTREDCIQRQWAETLLGRELEIGEDFDTDIVLESPCIITVRHDEPRAKKDGTNFYPCPVDEVFPVSSGDDPWGKPEF